MTTSQRRVLDALNHRSPDRIPVDFGSTAVTGMHVRAVAALREHFGLEKRPVKVCEPYQMLGEIEPDLQAVIGIDAVGMVGPANIFGFRNEGWKPFRASWGQELLVPAGFETVQDTTGDLLIFPQGDRNAPPSGRMPVGGYFFDTIVRQPPIDEERLDPQDNLEEFTLLDDDALAWYRQEAERLRDCGKAVVAGVPGTAFGDIALVPAPFLKHPKGIRDVAEWYMSTALRQGYLHAIFEEQCRTALANLALVDEAAGDVIDVLFVCGTDFGTQTSQFCSVETFQSLYAPYYREVNRWVHEHTNWKTFKHSCGAVLPLVEPFIEAGFDIVNPVQCSATDMDPSALKQQFGGRITFWGGGIDTQGTLPFGTPEQIRGEVRERCEVFGPGGGFVFNAIHNIQADTPLPNLVALIEGIQRINGNV
jgi:hypothetical protein